jgi:hypothetical protein
MTYSDTLDDLARQVDSLGLRRKAAVFWLMGSGLLSGLHPPAAWKDWMISARTFGYHFVVTGEVMDGTAAAWEASKTPTEGESSQLLNSVIICLSTPLEIAAHPGMIVGSWVEHALFPIIQSESSRLFDDVAIPDDDDELEEVFRQPNVQRAVNYGGTVLARLAGAESEPDGQMLDELLEGADVLAPPTS